jgi:hypothetical protein
MAGPSCADRPPAEGFPQVPHGRDDSISEGTAHCSLRVPAGVTTGGSPEMADHFSGIVPIDTLRLPP